MGGKRITEEQENHYWALRAKGWSISRAAREAGFSIAAAKQREALRSRGVDYRKAKGEGPRLMVPDRPIPLDEISQEAKDALADRSGALFCKRYLGWELLPWQQMAWEQMEDLWDSPDREFALFNMAPGAGKALALDTPIPTPSGWTTMKDLEVGDEVFDESGKPCKVTARSPVFYGHDCYEVRSDDGASVIADAEHLWSVRLGGAGQYRNFSKPARPGKTGPKPSPDGRHVHTTDYLAKRKGKRAQLQITAPLDLPTAELPIDPYVLGAWLGDGDSSSGRMTSAPEDAVHLRQWFERAGYPTSDHQHPMNFGVHGLYPALRTNGLLNNKHVPDAYLRAAPEQRLALLQGLVDTDGHVTATGEVEFCSTNRRLAEAVQQLVLSLGAKCRLAESRATLYGKDCGPRHRVTFLLAGAARLPRKAERCRDGARTPSRYLTFTPVESVPTQCIVVDSPNHLFLAGEGLMVTHNSTIIVGFACKRIVLDRAIRTLFISRAHSLAERNAMRVRRALERVSPPPTGLATLAGDFGRFKPKQGGDVWKRDEFVVEQMDGTPIEEKEPTVSSFGFDSEWIGNRVELVLGDDLDTTRSTRNLEIVEKNREVFDNELEPRLESGGLFVVTQQRLSAFDFSAHCKSKLILPDDDGSGDDAEGTTQYRHIVYKAHYEEKCAGLPLVEQRALHSSTAEPWPAGCLLSPTRLGWRDVRKAMNNRDRFDVVYQQNDPGESGALVQKLWVDGGRGPDGQLFIGCWDNDRGLWQLPDGLEGDLIGVMTVDPSVTRYWSVQAWVYHPVSQARFLIDLHRERMDAPDFLDWSHTEKKFVGLAEDWFHNFAKLGVKLSWLIAEANAAHRHMLQYEHFHRWMRAHSVQVIGHSTQRNKADEELGVEMLKPRWRDGQVRLPGKGQARIQSLRLVDEVTRYPNSVTTDCLMAQWFLEHNLDRIWIAAPEDQPKLKRPGWLKRRAA